MNNIEIILNENAELKRRISWLEANHERAIAYIKTELPFDWRKYDNDLLAILEGKDKESLTPKSRRGL